MSDTEVCDHEFDGEECEECGAHVSEYVETLRARIAELTMEVERLRLLRSDQIGPDLNTVNPMEVIASLRARVAELEDEQQAWDGTYVQLRTAQKTDFERAEKAEASVAELEALRDALYHELADATSARDFHLAEVARLQALAALAHEAVERLSRLAEGKEGRKPQVALGWIRECTKDIRAPLALALSGTTPAPTRAEAEAYVAGGEAVSGTLAFHATASPVSEHERAKELIEQAVELVGSYSADRNNESKTLNAAVENMYAAITLLTEK